MLAPSSVARSTLHAALLFACALAGCALAGAAAQAGVLIQQGPGTFTGDSNAVFNPCGAGAVTGPAATVTGCLNDAHDSLVDFTGNEDLLADGGQARVSSAADDGFTFLRIEARENGSDADFATLIVNINLSDFTSGPPSGTNVAITAYVDGLAQSPQVFAVSENGENFFRLSTDDGSLFSAVEFEILQPVVATTRSGGGSKKQDPSQAGATAPLFEDFRQVRLGGVLSQDPGQEPTLVPTPGTLALLGSGLLGVALLQRTRRRRA